MLDRGGKGFTLKLGGLVVGILANNNKKGRKDLQMDESRKPSQLGSVLCVLWYGVWQWGGGGGGGASSLGMLAVQAVVVL
jgi:hypothetical protein